MSKRPLVKRPLVQMAACQKPFVNQLLTINICQATERKRIVTGKQACTLAALGPERLPVTTFLQATCGQISTTVSPSGGGCMRRALAEWGFIASLSAAIFCFGGWLISSMPKTAELDFVLPVSEAWHWRVQTNDGLLEIHDNYGSGMLTEYVIERQLSVKPAPTGVSQVRLPGFRAYVVHWGAGSNPNWTIKLSLLIPSLIFLVLGAIFLLAYMKIRSAALKTSSAQRKLRPGPSADTETNPP